MAQSWPVTALLGRLGEELRAYRSLCLLHDPAFKTVKDAALRVLPRFAVAKRIERDARVIGIVPSRSSRGPLAGEALL